MRVNCVGQGGAFNQQDPTFVARSCARTFLGRMANETDLTGAFVFLASDASAYLAGAILRLNSGYTAKSCPATFNRSLTLGRWTLNG